MVQLMDILTLMRFFSRHLAPSAATRKRASDTRVLSSDGTR